MCVDYRDLNRVSPKDNFPLPHIDTLVDNTAGHALFSFMDGFSGMMKLEEEKELFTNAPVLMESTALTGRMTRWQMLLSEFDIVYMNKKAVKRSVIADFLACRALEDYKPMKFDFPNEDLMSIFVAE
ncbi:uncharacterized protein LOC120176012 [Hibiscus syriacus]|uniref:uncharacterized protein LOC120176012 n=1 Tax=Hibiscus syriacus TaxID=106335 RepID=UPI0019207EFA|nr:uncharacterized protein LOC120176012 [Hibiscus syriacus]